MFIYALEMTVVMMMPVTKWKLAGDWLSFDPEEGVTGRQPGRRSPGALQHSSTVMLCKSSTRQSTVESQIAIWSERERKVDRRGPACQSVDQLCKSRQAPGWTSINIIKIINNVIILKSSPSDLIHWISYVLQQQQPDGERAGFHWTSIISLGNSTQPPFS